MARPWSKAEWYQPKAPSPRPPRNRSRRNAFAVTRTVAPVSARIAIHSVVTPNSVVIRNTLLSPSARPMFCRMLASVARDNRRPDLVLDRLAGGAVLVERERERL